MGAFRSLPRRFSFRTSFAAATFAFFSAGCILVAVLVAGAANNDKGPGSADTTAARNPALVACSHALRALAPCSRSVLAG